MTNLAKLLPLAQPVPPRISLLTSADVTVTSDAEAAAGADAARWMNGVLLPSPLCSPSAAGAWWDDCDLGAESEPDAGDEGVGPDALPDDQSNTITTHEFHPWTIWVPFGCGSVGADADEFRRLAELQMEAWQSHLIAEELSTATVRDAAQWGDVRFQTEFDNEEPYSPVVALAAAEDRLGRCMPGMPGMIHTSRNVATYLVRAGLLFPEANGRRLRTLFGTVVSVDSGYNFGAYTGSSGATDGLVISGLMQIFLGPVRRLVMEPGDAANHPYGIDVAEMDFSTNTHVGLVERAVLAAWPNCCDDSYGVLPIIDIDT